MSSVPRIFVGTMYTNEGDFKECIERIHQQEGVVVSHSVISGLREQEAHNALWHAWREARSSNDLFVKVDADTVLYSKTTLADIWELFEADQRVTGLQAPLLDYMTNGFINGLNVFSTRVTFNDTKDDLHCDRQIDVDHDIVIRGSAVPEKLRPAGFHCYRASEEQAFHFGLHRQLKGQHNVLYQVKQAWLASPDRIRGMALIGASVSPQFSHHRRFNYNDAEFKEAFAGVVAQYERCIQAVTGVGLGV